jgi:hypothetical protein
MDSPRTFCALFVATVLLVFAGIMSLNAITEPYGLFRTDFNKQQIEPNQHFIKMRFILRNSEKYDSFLFGSSRVGKINLRNVPDGRYYNMTYSEGLPHEFLQDIKLMIKHGVKIRHLLIGLDDFSYKVDPAVHYEQKMRYPYTEQEWSYYGKTLFTLPTIQDLELFMFPKKDYFFTFYDIYGSGRPIIDNIEEAITNNTQRHISDPKFRKPTHYEGNRIAETLQDIRNIVALAKQNGIQLTVFINPIHIVTYLDANPEQFNQFKRELADITDFYDFSGINTITVNNLNYYETSHYRIGIGDLIVYRLFKDITTDPDFGVYVTRMSVDEHISRLRTQVVEYLLSK